jgi:hypothetical protein
MTQYTPVDLVLACCRALDFVREEPPNTNAGQAVEAIQKVTGNQRGAPWCASYVAKVGTAALELLWPLKLTGSVAQLAKEAESRGVLVTVPLPGDVFVIWFPSLNRFAHTGFVVSVNGSEAVTIEGNTSGGGSREGWGVFTRKRTFGPKDRFIRWTGLL